MDAGELDQFITIYARAAGRSPAGQPSGAWDQKVGEEWASKRGTNGMETIRADAVTALPRVSFRTRWRDAYTTAMRVQHGTVWYDIKAVQPDHQHRQHVDLVCEQIKA